MDDDDDDDLLAFTHTHMTYIDWCARQDTAAMLV